LRVTLVEWSVQAGLALALLATLPLAARLERALSALKRDRAMLAESARGFSDATREAEAAVVRLRAAADNSGRSLAEQIQLAATLREDLRFLSERAEAIAERLDGGVRAARPAAAEPAPAAVPRARAEADLLRALRGGRRA
jgi:hypothetical protein